MYTLRFPFELPHYQEIKTPIFSVPFGDLEIDFKNQDRFYVLTVKGFPSEDAAAKFIPKLWAGLMWLLINRGFAAIAETKLQKVVLNDDPVKAAENLRNNLKLKIDGEVHGAIDDAQPAVYSSNGNFVKVGAGKANIRLEINASEVEKHILEGAAFPNASKTFENKKLKIALELYGAFFTEISQNAKFLILVMVLESLAESEKRLKVVLDLLKRFREQVEVIEENLSDDSEDFVSLESLKRELIFRQEDSIRKQIRSLVFNTLSENGDADAKDVAKLAVKVYDRRSTLVHEGSLPSKELGEAGSNAKVIVERVLKAKFIQLMNGE